jgi:hypothetical protein
MPAILPGQFVLHRVTNAVSFSAVERAEFVHDPAIFLYRRRKKSARSSLQLRGLAKHAQSQQSGAAEQGLPAPKRWQQG